jgi:hypothetical protein
MVVGYKFLIRSDQKLVGGGEWGGWFFLGGGVLFVGVELDTTSPALFGRIFFGPLQKALFQSKKSLVSARRPDAVSILTKVVPPGVFEGR